MRVATLGAGSVCGEREFTTGKTAELMCVFPASATGHFSVALTDTVGGHNRTKLRRDD